MIPNVSSIVIVLLTSSVSHGGAPGLSWSQPTHNLDGTLILVPLTYNVYRSHDGGGYQQIRAGIKVTDISITGDLVMHAKECFEITAIENGIESDRSPSDCITLP